MFTQQKHVTLQLDTKDQRYAKEAIEERLDIDGFVVYCNHACLRRDPHKIEEKQTKHLLVFFPIWLRSFRALAPSFPLPCLLFALPIHYHALFYGRCAGPPTAFAESNYRCLRKLGHGILLRDKIWDNRGHLLVGAP